MWTDRKGVWDTSRATRALTLETSTRLGVRLTFQDYRHVAKLIDREHVRTAKDKRHEDDPDDDDAEEDGGKASAHDLACGHQITTADGVYGIDASMLRSLSDRTMRAFRSVAEKWHRFLGLSSRQSPVVPILRRSLSTACIASRPSSPPPTKRRQGGDAEEETRHALAQLLGSHADFRSHEQKQALVEIHRGTSPLVVVLPTGGGKSLCFQLPASMTSSSSVTIVIVPFTALLKSLQQRCRLLGLACVQWTVEQPQSASVTLVVAETATCDSFFTFASGLQSCGRLRAIFLDECHVAVTASAYRSKLAELDQLRKIPCQYVLLTGTLPPALQARLCDVLLLGTYDDGLRYVRALTDKGNVAYHVQTCRDGQLERRAAQLMQQIQRQLPTSAKAILFCLDTDTCERMASLLACEPYHANWRAKDAAMAAWVDGKNKVIVATSALVAGIDVADVCFVVHMGQPYGLVDFVQGVGRGGRHGEKVGSIVLLEEQRMRQLEGGGAEENNSDREALRRYLTSKDCRRKQIGLFMDMAARTCTESQGEMCDRCAAHQAIGQGERNDAAENSEDKGERYMRGVELWQQRVRERGRERADLEGAIDEIGHCCAGCWVHGIWTEEHRKQACPRIQEAVQEHYSKARRMIRYEGGSTCWACSQPGDWCPWYTKHQRCVQEDIIVPIVFSGWALQEVRALLAAEGVKDVPALLRWMGAGQIVGGSKGSKAAWLASRIICVIKKESKQAARGL